MYVPGAFREHRLELMHGLIRSHPLGMLITSGPSGLLASPIPFLIYAQDGERGTLRAHLARANPHAKELRGGLECLVVFQAEQGYVTPSWYPSKAATHQAVPTWNYATVQARGKATPIEDAAWLRRQLDDLTNFHEHGRMRPWAIRDAPADYIATQMKAIVGIEIPIANIEGKWKMSQNKDDADRVGIVDGLRADADRHQNLPLAELVELRLRESSEPGS